MQDSSLIENERQRLSSLLEEEIKKTPSDLIAKSAVQTLSFHYSLLFEKLHKENEENFRKISEINKDIENLKIKNQTLKKRLEEKKLGNRLTALLRCYKNNFFMGVADFQKPSRFSLVKFCKFLYESNLSGERAVRGDPAGDARREELQPEHQ